jgi:hypothetical protein
MALIYQPFVYRWTNTLTSQWYIGSRTAKGCHPEDGYTTSSKILLELLATDASTWTREILFVGTTVEQVIEHEANLLRQLDAKNNPQSLNQHNGDGKFYFKLHTNAAREKMRTTPRRKPQRQPMSAKTKAKIRDKMLGRQITWRHKISAALIGIPKKAVNT